jgi:hypothetical protein
MKDLPLKLVAGALVLVLLWAMLGSERYLVLSNRPMIVHLSNIKTGPEMGDLVGELDSYGIHLPRHPGKLETMGWLAMVAKGYRPNPASLDHMSPAALGYSVREVSFFGMPFGFYTEYGHVLYIRNEWGTIYAPLSGEGLEKVNRVNGRDVTKGYIYPYWAHLWGWAFVAGLAFGVFLWLQRAARKREQDGII